MSIHVTIFSAVSHPFPLVPCLTCLSVSRTFHRLFDQNAWLLVPEQAIIDEYHAVRTEREKFPSLKNVCRLVFAIFALAMTDNKV